FTYGLGRVTSTGSTPSGEGQLGLLAHGSTRPGGVFTVTALLTKPKKGQKVEIKLPEGLELVSGQSREQTGAAVEKGKDSQLSWRVQVGKSTKAGEYAIQVTSGKLTEQFTVKVRDKSIFD